MHFTSFEFGDQHTKYEYVSIWVFVISTEHAKGRIRHPLPRPKRLVLLNIRVGDVSPVIWTSQITKAKIFTTDESVEEFKYHFLHDRTCDIIRIK